MTSSREEDERVDERVMEIVAAARRKPAGEREAYLQSACAGDEELRREVVDALAWEERMGGFLQQPVAVIADGNLPDAAVTGAVQFAAGLEIGQYRIESKLGEGGMSSVWLALDTRLGRRVAIKFLSDDLADAEARRRFQREAQMASSLNHPHIVTVYDIGEFEGRHYLVTEYVDGGTLKDWVKEKRRTAKEVAELLTGVADGLAAAHQAGILHRDIKPQNILVARNGYAKLADFGLAKLAENGGIDLAARSPEGVTRPGLILGTITYMSPEQASGQPLDSRSDIFSFGVVLYEMLSGKRPFGGRTDLEVLKTIIDGELPPLSDEVPEAYRNIVEKALEKSPAERYQSMREMVVDLRRARRSASPLPPPPHIGDTHLLPETASLRGQTRRPWLAWGAAAFLTGVLLAGIAFLILAVRRPHSSAMHFRAVTNFSGVQSHPALSPDGRSVAFVSNRDGHYNIYVGLLNGANPVKLTDDPNLKTTPCWSPDGTEIAYGRLNDSGIWDIWKVPALGGTSRRLILNALDPSWSRDGRWLAYRTSSTGAIWISDASGQNGRELTRAQSELFGNSGPRFSPDGREVAYTANLGGPTRELEIVDVDSGRVRRLTHDWASVVSPAWSADGRFIYFASSRGGTLNIWKIAEKGGELVQITTGQGDDTQLDISADGRRIVFSTFRSNVNLAELDLDSAGQKNSRLLIADLARSQYGPVYSPDAKHLAYFSTLKGVEREGIWLANSDGSDPVPLVQDGLPNIFPRWTPDSAYLVYVVQPSVTVTAPVEFRRISISGGAPQTLLRNVSDVFPDVDSGGQLLFKGPHGEVQVSSSQKIQTLITLPPDQMAFLLRWSPDHQSIAYLVYPTQEGDPRAGVWVFDRNGPPRQVFRGWITWYAWGPGNEIYLVQAKPDLEGVLWKVDRSGRDLTRVPVSIPLPFDYWYVVPQTQFDISPDGRRLAFAFQQVLQANIGMLENIQ